MKKILSLFTFILLFSLSALYAQIHTSTPKAIPVKKAVLNLASKTDGVMGACDSVNLDAAGNWSAFYYTNSGGGYTFGVGNNNANGYNVLEDANHFDVSAYDYNYISGGLAFFAFANSNKSEDLDKDVIFKVYDDGGGFPGNLLGSTTLKLSQIKQDVENGFLTEFKFSSPVPIPASKVFYISIDHSNFKWGGGVRDSLAIVANENDDTTGDAYQYIDVSGLGIGWFNVSDSYSIGGDPLDVNLFIFPYVSNASDGCGVLPVSIFNFGGFIKSNTAYLNWSTATESNNKGFYIERSKDGQNFSSLGFVNGAGNSSQIKNYTYNDVTVKDILATTTYYRLKQVDLDGKTSYSKVLKLNLNNTEQWRLYPNPVKDAATVELNLTKASKVNVQVISRDGRIIMNTDKGILNAGVQQVYINMQSLAKGSYIVRVKTDDDVYTKMVVKE